MKRKVGFHFWSANLVFIIIRVCQAEIFGCACLIRKCVPISALQSSSERGWLGVRSKFSRHGSTTTLLYMDRLVYITAAASLIFS